MTVSPFESYRFGTIFHKDATHFCRVENMHHGRNELNEQHACMSFSPWGREGRKRRKGGRKGGKANVSFHFMVPSDSSFFFPLSSSYIDT